MGWEFEWGVGGARGGGGGGGDGSMRSVIVAELDSTGTAGDAILRIMTRRDQCSRRYCAHYCTPHCE